MTREEYLASVVVSDFVNWLGPRLHADDLQHQYTNHQTGIVFQFNSLRAALDEYTWNDQNYETNCERLSELTAALNAALQNHSEEQLRAAAIDVVIWGGVRQGNLPWLQNPNSDVWATISQTRALLLQNDDDVFEQLPRFNAGMSKIFSLITPNFIIYDSRVAAALTWFVAKWCVETHRATVPAPLRLVCPPHRIAGEYPILRNPSGDGLYFPANNDPVARAQANLRASWILTTALDSDQNTLFHQEDSPLRALEAALFVWGYDLSESCPWI